MNDRLIAITGFMASGKTTVGRALATSLDCRFIDLDELIAAQQEKTIKEIIDTEGEDRFRRLETKILSEVLPASGDFVIALGGGTWNMAENRRLLQDQNACVVWLDAPFELCWKRIPVGDNGRPLAPSHEIAKKLYRARRPVYELAELRLVVSESKSAKECADEISSLLLQRNSTS
jgi:shikimate kinase